MNAVEVIERMASNEGRAIPRTKVVDAALLDLTRGVDMIFVYGDVVFSVGVINNMVHLYSTGATSLLLATRRFMKDVWRMEHDFLWAPMDNPKLESAAKRFGWQLIGAIKETDHRIYLLKRPKNE